MTKPTANVWKDEYWDHSALVRRTRWQIDLPHGARKRVDTRREAIEWCEEHDFVPLVIAKPIGGDPR